MSTSARDEHVYDITCPHCRKPFTARLMAGSAARYRGFKCPHCKLFVPLGRVEREVVEPTGSA